MCNEFRQKEIFYCEKSLFAKNGALLNEMKQCPIMNEKFTQSNKHAATRIKKIVQFSCKEDLASLDTDDSID